MVYLDNAATSFPKSEDVLNAMKEAFYTCGNGGRGGHPLAVKASETIYGCREVLSELFGTAPERIVLTGSATAALNIAIKGLAVGKGDALCSVMEHNAVLRPLYSVFPRRLRILDIDLNSSERSLQTATKKMKDGVSLAVFTHASNVCGIKLPVKELCEEAHRKGIITIVDCAQSAGHLPVNIEELGADVICFPGHKGLGGAMGVGGLAVHPRRELNFKTLIEGGTGTASRDHFMPPVLPERLEAGTANVTGIAALAAACKALKLESEKEESLRAEAVKALKALKGVTVYATGWDGGYAPVVAFNIDGIQSEKAAEALAEKGVFVRGGLHCAPLAHTALSTGKYGAIRASFGKSNTAEDVDALVKAVAEVGKI